ncbi:MAG TPA: PQQ-binding-like beta-propeller repeat protein [Blastocatellia bacterium]|jgi:quinoprotein glucose dehydrogenase
MSANKLKLGLAAALAIFAVQFAPQSRRDGAATEALEWRAYGGGPENTHYSALRQITRENVKQLQVAWIYDAGDVFDGSEMECNPIVVGGALYATSPKLRVFALDAATGKELWSFDPNEGRRPAGKARNRGVTYWEGDGGGRIFFGFRNWIYALDARTGEPVKSFGAAGRIDLREGLGRPPQELSVGLTSPGVIYKGLLIVGSVVSETLPAAPGHIRAYDVRTGELRWTFHTIPQPGEFGYETWPKDAWRRIGGANNWSGMALDEKRGLVFAPTGSASFDFYGANRRGDNLFADSLICLDAATGERKWHFQTIRHDLWDRDLPSAPALVTVRRGGRVIDAVAQITKSGHVFVFERETGKPVFPIEYRKVSTRGVDGEEPADTQPAPLLPPPIARQILTEEMLTRRTPEAHRDVLRRFRELRGGYRWDQFEPPTREGTIVFPGFDGGPGWGGAAFDPATGLFIVNSSEVPCILRLVERPLKGAKGEPTAKSLYERNCASCHGRDLLGAPPEFPALTNLGRKYNESEIISLIRTGAGRMPGFPSLNGDAARAIVRYLMTGEDAKLAPDYAGEAANELKYTIDGYNRFLDPDGYPAVEPPWGTLNAIDLNQGKIVWKIPLGEHPELAAQGIRGSGSWNYGGPIVTGAGVVFIGATNYDKKFRAFDQATGKLLWETTLPAAGNATPATYQVGGRQFVVVAAGGGKRGGASGGKYVAFALPQNR